MHLHSTPAIAIHNLIPCLRVRAKADLTHVLLPFLPSSLLLLLLLFLLLLLLLFLFFFLLAGQGRGRGVLLLFL